MIKNLAYIGGRWVAAQGEKTFSVLNPVDLAVLADVPDMGKADVHAAIDAAAQAFASWSALSPVERADILEKWSSLIAQKAQDLALLMTYEQGKPLSEAQGEATAAAATIRWCAEEGRRLYGEFIEGHRPGTNIVVSRRPAGVCGAITPWNFPVGMITRKVGPALAAGCTVVLKPAEATPLCALALAALAEEAGIPPGVLNIVTSANAAEIGEVLTSDPRVRKISFTGSTAVGRKLMAQAARNIQKVSLELGGNAPFIVFPSADLEKAVSGAIASKFRNAGQTCICANRIYIHTDVYAPFIEMFLNKIKELKVGPGWEPDVAIGPLIDKEAAQKVEKLVADASAKGAKILCGGKRHALGGSFFEPTLIENVQDDAPIAREEIFGPVAVIYSFETEDEVVARANATEYGLASYIYTQDLAQAWRVSGSLDYGMVALNEPLLATDLAPFGGIKTSGIGREGGRYGLLEYTDLKYRLFG
ncbi:MAG TPA: NAD-dependent succinate-semialdehyde dehydrogenase [Micavibrio sp.]|nr:NAD-dependent succinate-semialdehyde dehydrogenase [Micavibrio sp.]